MAASEAIAPHDLSAAVCVLKKYSTCSAVDKERVLRCERASCPKFIHRSCSLRVTEPFRDDAEPFHVVCGKRCFNALSKGAAVAAPPLKPDADSTAGKPTATRSSPNERKKRAPWSSDGPTPEINSLAVLLEWLRDPKNYARWVNNGEESKYETKAAMAAQILAQIKARGVDTDRNPNDVFAKIYQLEKSFAEASEWLRENQDTTMDRTRLVEGAKRRCTYYYELVDSMGVDHFKGKSAGGASTSASGGTRKRGAAAANDEADATKRQHVGASGRELRPRNVEMNNRAAANIQATIAARIAATKKGPETPEKATTSTTITPALMNHSFLKATSNTLAPKKPSQETVNAAHMAALNASFLLASTLAAANTQPPKTTLTSASTATTTTTAIVTATPANTSSSAFGGSHRQTTGYSSSLRPKPAILGTTAAGLAELNAAKAKQSAAAKAATATSTSSTSSTAANACTVTTLATANSPASTTSANANASGSPGANPPMGFSTSMLQVNNSMLQATAEKLQAEAKIATITANTALLRARKTLRDEGIPQTEIDAVLPLARH